MLDESPSQESAPLLTDEAQPGHLRFIQAESPDHSADLATFLIQRACANSALVNYFYWYPVSLVTFKKCTYHSILIRYLMIECEDPEPNVKHDARVREMYLVVMKKFLQVIKRD